MKLFLNIVIVVRVARVKICHKSLALTSLEP